MFNKIIKKCKYHLKKYVVYYIQTTRNEIQVSNPLGYENKLKLLDSYVKMNDSLLIKIETYPVVNQEHFKWVGGQVNESNDLFGIVNGDTKILKYSHSRKSVKYFGNLPQQDFKWTGGCIYNKCIYGFLRSSNELLKIDVETEKIQQLPLGLSYSGEHHYGGVLTRKGIVYQPPRNTDHLLAIDLNTLSCHCVPLTSKWMRLKLRYCGSVLHPNGFIYFLPERGEKVIKFNSDTEEVTYIGGILDCMVFDAAIAFDGNIYGFSAYSRGILKIDIENNKTEMIHQELFAGCYGTKLGPNGKLYGIPGNGDDFLEFDVEKDLVYSIGKAAEVGKAKCAGGAVDHNGDIYCVPAEGDFLYKICFDGVKTTIPKEVYDDFYVDCY